MVRISEARLNDIVYMTLKNLFFVPCFNINPRECDIRICMDMAVPERIKSPAQAILLPNEQAGKSHTIFYEVDTDRLLSECIDYLEDHWMKQSLSDVFGEDADKKAKEWFAEMLPVLLEMPEEGCGS